MKEGNMKRFLVILGFTVFLAGCDSNGSNRRKAGQFKRTV